MLQDISPYLALAALVALVALLGIVVWLALMLRRLQAGQRAVLGPYGRRDLVEHIGTLEDQVRNLRDAAEMLTGSVEEYRHDLDGALSNCALVRYDAFMDPGGQQSASLALLDNYRSGIVLSLLASRDSSRLYVKYLDHGAADRELSPEETEAVQRAVPRPLPAGVTSGRPVPTLPRRLPVWEAREEAADEAPNPLQESFVLEDAARGLANGGAHQTQRAPMFAVAADELEALDEEADDTPADETPAAADETRMDHEAANETRPGEVPAARDARRRDDWLEGEDLDF